MTTFAPKLNAGGKGLSSSQINQLNPVDGAAQKAAAEGAELLH
jgi:hypothetical protein